MLRSSKNADQRKQWWYIISPYCFVCDSFADLKKEGSWLVEVGFNFCRMKVVITCFVND